MTLTCNAQILQDEFAMNSLKNTKPPYTHTKYNYQDTTKIPVRIVISKKIKSEKELYEGQIVEFKLIRHIIHNNKIIAMTATAITAITMVSIVLPFIVWVVLSVLLQSDCAKSYIFTFTFID